MICSEISSLVNITLLRQFNKDQREWGSSDYNIFETYFQEELIFYIDLYSQFCSKRLISPEKNEINPL